MILKFFAEKILRVCEKYGINKGGCAYSFGDQKTTFSEEWLEAAKDRLKQGATPQSRNPGKRPMESSDFFKSIGYSDYFDIDYNGNARLILDLGSPLPNELYNKADILFDGGVIEHIPNIYQAMCNVVLLLKKGALFFEFVPAAFFGGACYYNIDPTLLRGFYEANGFQTIECMLYYENIKFRRLRFFKSMVKSKIKPFIPNSILAYRKKVMEEMAASTLPNDDMTKFRFIDPLDPMVRLRFNWYGPPAGTHICYIGIKRRDIKPDNIIVPQQENYPSRLAIDN